MIKKRFFQVHSLFSLRLFISEHNSKQLNTCKDGLIQKMSTGGVNHILRCVNMSHMIDKRCSIVYSLFFVSNQAEENS